MPLYARCSGISGLLLWKLRHDITAVGEVVLLGEFQKEEHISILAFLALDD